MHPLPTDEQRDLMNAVRDVLANEVSNEKLAAWACAPGAAEEALLAKVIELGWLGYGAPEAAGGSGAGLVDVALLFEECGRGLLPLQILHHLRGVIALSDVAPEDPLLPGLVRGERTLALALDEEGARDPAHYATRIDGDRVRGRKAFVPNGERASHHLVAARDGDGLSLVVVANGGLGHQPLVGFADDSQAHVDYDGAAVISRLAGPAAGAEALERLWTRQRLLALAEMIGGMGWILERTVTYVQERWQFGQPIALFQAVRHQAADMATTITACRHLAHQAICRHATDTIQGTELVSALAYVGQAYKRICWAGHHLHGGMGYADEHPLHWYSERAQVHCIRYTPEAPLLADLAATLLD